MTFSEPFSALVLTSAVLVVIIDLWADGDRRKRMVTGHRIWWDRLRSVTHSRLMSEAASGFYGFPAIKIVEGRSRFSHIVVAFVAVGVAGTGSLVAGALLFAPDPEGVIRHALNYFAVPSAIIVLAWLAAGAGLLSWIARASSAPLQVLFVILLGTGAILMWVVLMHMGTWLEWQYKRTPIPYGTEWFYAEVYMEYAREPLGRLVSLTAALIVGLPALPCVLRSWVSTGCKCLEPFLAPLLGQLMAGLATARRGVLGALMVLIALLTGVLSV
ncbi:MAG: hypothetical protein V3R37_07640 [Rhodospirillales bacterium]